jgi:hypothetical protein
METEASMLAKYTVEYTARRGNHPEVQHYAGDDPVACEEFLEGLLERGCHIQAIRHDGMNVPVTEFDKMIKTAAGMMAARHICTSLGISTEEEHYRFGFSA